MWISKSDWVFYEIFLKIDGKILFANIFKPKTLMIWEFGIAYYTFYGKSNRSTKIRIEN